MLMWSGYTAYPWVNIRRFVSRLALAWPTGSQTCFFPSFSLSLFSSLPAISRLSTQFSPVLPCYGVSGACSLIPGSQMLTANVLVLDEIRVTPAMSNRVFSFLPSSTIGQA